jgi:hypothetical protein
MIAHNYFLYAFEVRFFASSDDIKQPKKNWQYLRHSKHFPPFLEHKGSLSCAQKPATFLYTDAPELNPYIHSKYL